MGADVAWQGWGEGPGLARWVGTLHGPLKQGAALSLPDGTRVTVVRCVPAKQLRLRLERDGWSRARTVQLRLIPSVHGITVALHAEGLPDAGVREELLARWTHVLEGWNAFSGRKVAVSRSGSLEREPAGNGGAEEAPSLEPGLAEKGAADLKKAGPVGGARGVKKSAARGAKSAPVKSRGGVKKGASAKRPLASGKTTARKTAGKGKPSPSAKKTRSRK
ncbi:hypothetical protein D7Y13_21370 [Corallococcus praedator]|uniref:DUF721 domain-containing protein n=1 Tax=Corallococcus praedator TaxID=2316724 RepID=A0ABX9QF80_9BACT|nr:hypothetical protein D7X74_19960 [Corallococcus sp. CA047B]RKH30752.1 hypothetical protein D7X75_20635 [Corallococcus sp. CA031C]RKI05930.1 hypothetical protein D7Y13_21370 [Corallococcus praedator]